MNTDFQVARLQEIINKIQYFCKLNFKNPIDVEILLEADGLNISDINRLIGAGVKHVGFHQLDQLIEHENMILPCKKHYLGELEGHNLGPILANFDIIESLVSMEQALEISNLNAHSGRISSVLLKLNILSDIKKFGFSAMEIGDSCLEIAKLSGIRVLGLSTYVPEMNNEKMVKTALRKAGTMFKMLESRYRGFEKFSINHHNNLRDLVAEGVNEIRIGLKSLV